MALNPSSELRGVTGITPTEEAGIRAFLQGAVYAYIKLHRRDPFAARDLVGGVNFDWDGTPLLPLYEKHVNQGKSSPNAIEAAGRDLGWLLKSVLAEDKRTFISSKAELVSHYEWVGGES